MKSEKDFIDRVKQHEKTRKSFVKENSVELSEAEIALLKGLIADEIYYKENHELTKGHFKFVYDKLKALLKKLESVEAVPIFKKKSSGR